MLINQCSEAFKQDGAWKTGRDLAFGALACMGRHTLTGMLTASGQQFMDWSSAYRLFSHQRVDTSKLFVPDFSIGTFVFSLSVEYQALLKFDSSIAHPKGIVFES